MNVDGYSMFLDMSSYPDLNELMIVADALISDYSSIYFDFSVTHKPMYCYAYDYDRYMSNRGMYLNLKDELPCVIHQDEDDLILLQISQ
ncbi:MAG: CDP-glycerol glycerophosphotransferase family protein [Oscillospiraceae bacterium]|nr:CDP-glycerol glycerophosphotransferase family protein [Oscillospiraceae bacterium]